MGGNKHFEEVTFILRLSFFMMFYEMATELLLTKSPYLIVLIKTYLSRETHIPEIVVG